jgi:hypothetical protein
MHEPAHAKGTSSCAQLTHIRAHAHRPPPRAPASPKVRRMRRAAPTRAPQAGTVAPPAAQSAARNSAAARERRPFPCRACARTHALTRARTRPRKSMSAERAARRRHAQRRRAERRRTPHKSPPATAQARAQRPLRATPTTRTPTRPRARAGVPKSPPSSTRLADALGEHSCGGATRLQRAQRDTPTDARANAGERPRGALLQWAKKVEKVPAWAPGSLPGRPP